MAVNVLRSFFWDLQHDGNLKSRKVNNYDFSEVRLASVLSDKKSKKKKGPVF